MFSKIRDLGLSTIDKAKQRANTLFTSMKDKTEEERKKPKGLGFSIFDKDEEKPKVTEPKTYEKAKTMIDKEQQEKDKLQKRADLLYSDKKEETKEERSKRLREENEEYLKKNAHLEQFGIDHVDKKVVKGLGKLRTGEEAAENLHMSKTKSYMDTEYAKKHKVYNNYNEAPDNLKK